MSTTTVHPVGLPPPGDLDFVDELAALVTSKLDEIESGIRRPLEELEKVESDELLRAVDLGVKFEAAPIDRDAVTEEDVGRFLLFARDMRESARWMVGHAEAIEGAIVDLYKNLHDEVLPGEREHLLDLHESYVQKTRERLATKGVTDA